MKRTSRLFVTLALVLTVALAMGTAASAASGGGLLFTVQPTAANNYTAAVGTDGYTTMTYQWYEIGSTNLEDIGATVTNGEDDDNSVDSEVTEQYTGSNVNAVSIKFKPKTTGYLPDDRVSFNCTAELSAVSGTTILSHVGNAYIVSLDSNSAFGVYNAESTFTLTEVTGHAGTAVVGETTATLTDGEVGKTYYLRATGDETYTARSEDVTVAAPELLYATTLTLEDSIDINFYVKLNTESKKDISKFAVASTFNGAEVTPEALTFVKTDTDTNGGTYNYYKVRVASASSYEMTRACNITVSYDGEEIKKVENYSVQKYCTNQIENSSDENLVALCTAALDYGGNAQLYFNGMQYDDGTDELATYSTDPEHRANLETNAQNTVSLGLINLNDFTASKEGPSTNVSASLLLGSEVSLKFYFTSAKTPTDATAEVVGDPDAEVAATDIASVGKSGTTNYSVKIPNIKARDLMKSYTLTISAQNSDDTEITYSPMVYVKNHTGTSKLGKLCTALAVYGNAAKTYFDAQQQ